MVRSQGPAGLRSRARVKTLPNGRLPAGNSIAECAVRCAQAFAAVCRHPLQNGTPSGTQPETGLDHARRPESKCLSCMQKLERAKGFEPSTPTLGA